MHMNSVLSYSLRNFYVLVCYSPVLLSLIHSNPNKSHLVKVAATHVMKLISPDTQRINCSLENGSTKLGLQGARFYFTPIIEVSNFSHSCTSLTRVSVVCISFIDSTALVSFDSCGFPLYVLWLRLSGSEV